jgi:hypothetical protein
MGDYICGTLYVKLFSCQEITLKTDAAIAAVVSKRTFRQSRLDVDVSRIKLPKL